MPWRLAKSLRFRALVSPTSVRKYTLRLTGPALMWAMRSVTIAASFSFFSSMAAWAREILSASPIPSWLTSKGASKSFRCFEYWARCSTILSPTVMGVAMSIRTSKGSGH